jgi:BlaI family transcriptional regulator, penicillinase repressor
MPDALYSPSNGTRPRPSRRRSVLDLAPLELDCMNTLWPLGEATVRDIRDRLAERRPRAYTTIMTIMDRLTRKGVVERRKSGRAYVYRAHLTAADARSQALTQLVENFFAGSVDALLAQLARADRPLQTEKPQPESPDPQAEPAKRNEAPRAFAAAIPFKSEPNAG